MGTSLTTPCIEWQGAMSPQGYGNRRYHGTVMSAHRVAYIENYGEQSVIGLVVDHLCRNRACINVDHLEAVDDRENVARGEGPTAINKRKTHCIHGHEFTEANTYREGNSRKCIECRRKKGREWARRKRSTIQLL